MRKADGVRRRHLDRKTPWRLVKKYCKAAGIDPDRLGQRGIGIHFLRKTAINDAIRDGADARGQAILLPSITLSGLLSPILPTTRRLAFHFSTDSN